MRGLVGGLVDRVPISVITMPSSRHDHAAPKYAGQYKSNPIAMLLTAKLMLDWLKETEMATRLESAIARVIAEGKVRTYDMGGKLLLSTCQSHCRYASS